MVPLDDDLVQRLVVEVLVHGLPVVVGQSLRGLPALRLEHPLQRGQHRRHFPVIQRIQVFPDEVEVDIARQRLPVYQLYRQRLVEGLLKLLHLFPELLPQLLELQLLYVRQFVLVVYGSGEALAPPLREEFPDFGPDLVFGVLFVTADRHQRLFKVLAAWLHGYFSVLPLRSREKSLRTQ